MDSSLAGRPERVGPVEVGDIKKDLLAEFSAMPTQVGPPRSALTSDRDCVTIEGPDTVVLKPPRSCQSNRQSDKSLPQTAQRFTFTQVFGPEASQRKVFEGSVRGLVRDVLQGGNCLVFTYGVTNAGKTFTFLGPDHDSGLLPRSLSVIFNSIDGRLYGRCDLKPQRCRDFSRLTPDQQAAESSSKRNLLRMLKESDRSATAGRSAFLEGSSLSSDSSVNSVSEADSFCLDVDSNVRFSVWVSFCEIYNENIHDLLEQVTHTHTHTHTDSRRGAEARRRGSPRRLMTVFAMSSDLRWVQVSSSEEAYRVMKIGKRNQSFSSTRLNQLSSRSHSIFSIRILRVDDVGVPRVLGISELALCDLAGSERCSRTHNTGERLKEAGNINSSLLTLGKCIHAMRLNQNAKFQHHIPFRESKLTHFLQFFFCGAGRVSMVVNINQNSSCFDETLNVLKFSALAQKVVVLNSRPTVPDGPDSSQRSAMELSLIIDEADCRRNVAGRGRKSSLVAWETSLEDVLEDEDGEEGEEDGEEESMMEGTVLEAGGENEEEWDVTMEEEEKQEGREAALRLVLEAQVREEVSAEFMELFKKMEEDYREDEKQRGANRRVVLEEEIWRLQEENDRKNEAIVELRGREEELQQEKARLEEELRSRVAEVEGLKKEQVLLEEQLLALRNLDGCPNCDTVLVSLEAEQREASRLQKENKALVNGIFQLQTEVTSLQVQLKQQTDRSDSLSEQFKATKTRLHDLEHQSEEKNDSISSLTQELERLRQEVKEEEGRSSSSVFHAAMEELKKESKAALQRSAQKSQQIEELQTDKRRLEAELTLSENRCAELREELANQRAEVSHQLESLRAELDSEGDALQAAFQDSEERRRQREMEVGELQRVLDEKEKHLEERRQQVETLSRASPGQADTPFFFFPFDLVYGENKRNKPRANARCVQERGCALQKIEEAIHTSPCVLGSKDKNTSSGEKEAVTVATKPRRGRRKLYNMDPWAPMVDSPHTTPGAAAEDRESDHSIMKRKLRSQTCRK
ncbi:kinesin-like protein KIF20B [Neolamprologus brichardi]|uniref:kinesin-like protein KIF20B n=1 Tax=Neolamprologus brichardi TaxID=32507 RepID=UPI001643F435|nr:kinesin-like protein KIF20B [Neolamprologus brichardi]